MPRRQRYNYRHSGSRNRKKKAQHDGIDEESNKYPGQLQASNDDGNPQNAIMTHMLCAADQLWLLRHAKGRLPTIEKQHIKSKLHKRIHKFWSMNTLFRPFGPVSNNHGPIENIDIENSFLNNPLLTFENLLFQNETHKDMHMVFVLDASLSLRTEDLWHLLLIVYGLQSLANSIELIAFSTEAKHIYRGRPFFLAKDLLQVYSQAIEPGYTNVEAGIRFGKEA
ncbi:MAG: hypothetical protein ACON4U_00970, partial [Myxococcota bacterium]